ncbi:Na+-transporting NADH:ubiquinone oxidoreductase subunit F [Yoonia maricola]|uniref:Na(+)-translocating NADH-quinone reductase subunit F n=1 Tax=Yoonia maricola TaxID=420999 RepID=A0A2M8W0B3_9RHOB|nr:NADH:ubiquinone reductase (Na(+)-transporting) subunit F [Yoonia maricola]PJI84367.1 Na+-transporting NADH:ubiquinone oxidoreductase subunit F [Yoonia maricola]
MTEILFGSVVVIALVLVLTATVILARAALMPERPATLTVNTHTPIATTTGQKLLSALNTNGILVPSACAGAGTCGLCRVAITNGGPASLPIEVARFTRAELRQGLHLACQVVVRDDMDIEVEEDLLGAEAFTCHVTSSRQLTPLIREVVLQMPPDMRPDFFAGSFVQVTAQPYKLDYTDIAVPERFEDRWTSLRGLSVDSVEDVTRAYSVSNRPEDTAKGQIVMNIRLALPPPSVADAPPGIVSSWLFSLQQGDPVLVSGPFGSFRIQPTEREMVFIGGGVGMAPLRAMIFEQLNQAETKRRMSFWYGARNKTELLYTEEIERLATQHSNFDWTIALSDPEPGDNWSGATGFVHDVALERYLGDHPAPENCEYYLCGPPLMIRAVLAMLDDLGVDADHIFNDDFGV